MPFRLRRRRIAVSTERGETVPLDARASAEKSAAEGEMPLGSRPIALIGFMGVGKSAVGRRLASQLGYEFVDTDHMVEAVAGKRVADIFAEDGEDVFRRLETEALTRALAEHRRVVATGGGAPARPRNAELLARHAAIVLLEASPSVILRRVRPLEKRPLLVGYRDPLERIKSLLRERRPYYAHYHFRVDTSKGTPGLTARRILEWYRGQEAAG